MLNKIWDTRFLELAKVVASWSKDPSTKVGAVIVDRQKRVRGIGFNGFARGIKDSEDLLNDRNEKLNRTIHAEINAVLNACKDVEGCTLYVTIPPCNMCTNFLIQVGIKRVVWLKPSSELLGRWGDSWRLTVQLLNEANVESVQYND